jgi:hypothetical protein
MVASYTDPPRNSTADSLQQVHALYDKSAQIPQPATHIITTKPHLSPTQSSMTQATPQSKRCSSLRGSRLATYPSTNTDRARVTHPKAPGIANTNEERNRQNARGQTLSDSPAIKYALTSATLPQNGETLNGWCQLDPSAQGTSGSNYVMRQPVASAGYRCIPILRGKLQRLCTLCTFETRDS